MALAHLRGKFRSEKLKDGTAATDSPSIFKTQMTALDDEDDDGWSSCEDKSYDIVEDSGGTAKRDLENVTAPASIPGSSSASYHHQSSALSLGQSSLGNTPPWGDNERSIYELQLQNLQEQLMEITIKNQGLASELNRYRQNKDLITLLKDLDKEKVNNEQLMQHCRDMEKRLATVRRQGSDEDSGSIDVGVEVEAGDVMDSADVSSPPPSARSRWFSSIQSWLVDKAYNIMADLSQEPEEDTEPKAEEEELSVKVLKENIKRAKTGYDPLGQWLKAVRRLKSWQSPSATLIAFCIYMYASWHGWLVSLMLGLILWHLTKTYLISIGWDTKFSLLPYEEIHDNSELDRNLGISDKFQIVLMVARKVQHLAGDLADSLEKLHNLMMWGKPEVTKRLYTVILSMLIASIFLPGPWLFSLSAMFLGFKMFIQDKVYSKFPRLKSKYDRSHIMWQSLPSHRQLSRSRLISQRQTYVVVNPDDGIDEIADPLAPEQRAFCELFELPPTEYPLQGWEDGKRCTLLNKDKPTNFKNGRIYLTKNFLCFERAKNRRSKSQNIVIPLAEITKLEKAKPFILLPGAGMSIEVHLPSLDRPYTFGGIIGRDEVYAGILKEMEKGAGILKEMEKGPKTKQRRGSSDSSVSSMIKQD